MKNLDKLSALKYIATNNPLCDNCQRADLEEVRIAAGLYQLVRELLDSSRESYEKDDLDYKIKAATRF